MSILRINIKKQNTVRYVGIKSIEHDGIEPVYNMEVNENHNYSICGGLIVHNCMDDIRYFCNTVLRRKFRDGREDAPVNSYYGGQL